MPISRNVRSSSSAKAATAFLISRSRCQCVRRLAISLQGSVSQCSWFDPSISNGGEPQNPAKPASSDSAGNPGAVRLISFSNSRSEEHTSELQSHLNLVCRLLLEKKK